MYLETERLILRNVRVEDAEDTFPLRHSEFVMQYNCMKPVTMDAYRAMLARNLNADGWLHLELKDSGRVIGMVGWSEDQIRYQVNAVNIDYYLGEQYAQQGYISEALRALIRYLFEEKSAELVSARVFGENTASQTLLEKLGFTLEGTLRKGLRTYDGKAHEDRLYSLLKEEFV